MKDLNMYEKALKKIKKGVLTSGIACMVAVSALTGCKSNEKNIENENVTVSNVLEGLSEKEDLTDLDDMLLNSNITKLDGETVTFKDVLDEYQQALKEYRETSSDEAFKKSNYSFYYLGKQILKAQIAKTYEIDINDISSFEVNQYGVRDTWEGELSYIYSVKFCYSDDTKYTIELKDQASRWVAYYTIHASYKDLPYYGHGGYNNGLKEANIALKEYLTMVGTPENESYSYDGKYENDVGSKLPECFDGSLSFAPDSKLVETVYKYITENVDLSYKHETEQTVQEETTNKLPKKESKREVKVLSRSRG